MATIKDVANKAGVSTATVSRVLNGNYPVSEQAKEKVLEAIQQLKYHPNAVARSLKQNRTYLIGILVPDISNPYFMDLARGVESVVADEGYSLLFGSTDEDAKKEYNLLKALNEKRVDGVILASRMKDSKKINDLIDQGLNVFMIDTYIDDVKADVVIENDFESAYNLMKYIIEKGHRRIAIVNGLMTVSTAKQRFEAYKKALKDYKINCKDQFILNGDFNRDKSYEVLCRLLESNGEKPTAIFSTNNVMTEGVLMALKEKKVKVPDEMSVVSFGNITLPKLVEPNLTYVRQNSYRMGEKVGHLIINKINGSHQEAKQEIINLEIKFGDSVKDMK